MSPTLAPTSTAASEAVAGGPTPEAQWTDVTLVGDNDWLGASLKALDRLRRLGPGWDGYGSPPPPSFLLNMADTILRSLWRLSGFLPLPSVVPVPGGSIQLEWPRDEKELEVILDILDHEPAAVQVRVLRTIDGVPGDSIELQEFKQLVSHLMWLIEE